MARVKETNYIRESWIDWAKTYLIYLVIVGHAGIPLHSLQWDYVYAFHMPAFFMISGYLYKPHEWKNTLYKFGVPIIIYSLVNLVIYIAIDILKGQNVVIDSLNTIWRPFIMQAYNKDVTLFPGIWFIEVLCVIRILMGDMKCFKWIRENALIVALVLMAVLLAEKNLNINEDVRRLNVFKLLYCLPFALIGYSLKEHAIMSKINMGGVKCRL